jgi:release factor glutamine methyltransferase
VSDDNARLATWLRVDEASRRLAAAGVESSDLDAQLLMAEAAGVAREAVVTGSIELSPAILKKFDALIARREKREPLAYIVGHKEFYSLDFEVTPAVLIPRPETEFVVTAALECVAGKADARVLDIGTGSGAIAIAIAINAPRAQITTVDISADAITVASRNVRRHQVQDRVTIRRGDCFHMLDGGASLGTFDAIVSNPPYLDDAEIASLEPEVSRFEPRIALNGGARGFEILQRITIGAREHLATDGELVLEMGVSQVAQVLGWIISAGLHVTDVINDLAGQMRVARARSEPNSRWKK